MNSFAQLAEGKDARFLIRWRGREEGPHSASAIEARLAANEIGLLHEIFADGKWITIRDYIAERERMLRAENQAREAEEQKSQQEADRRAREQEERQRAAALAEERRRNDLLAAGLERQSGGSPASATPQFAAKPHRSGLILTLGLIGLFVFGPLCLAAWIMGNGDLQKMDTGRMDASGRSGTRSGRNIGIGGTILWAVVLAVFLVASR